MVETIAHHQVNIDSEV
ncbi:hypothetical protein [Escherichia coli]